MRAVMIALRVLFVLTTPLLAAGETRFVDINAASAIVEIRYVDANAALGGDGQSWSTAYRYLQDALFEARDDAAIHEIRLAGGTYRPDLSEDPRVLVGDIWRALEIRTDLLIRGGFQGPGGDLDPDEQDAVRYPTVISGELLPNSPRISQRLFNVVDCELELRQLTLRRTLSPGGNGGGPGTGGGAIRAFESDLTVVDCVFELHRGQQGAAILIDGGSLHVLRSQLRDNFGATPRPEYNIVAASTDTGPVLFEDCRFENNAGLRLRAQDEIRGSTFLETNSDGTGGRFVNCLFDDADLNFALDAKGDGATFEACNFVGPNASLSGDLVALRNCRWEVDRTVTIYGQGTAITDCLAKASAFNTLGVNIDRCRFFGTRIDVDGAPITNCLISGGQLRGTGPIAFCTFVNGASLFPDRDTEPYFCLLEDVRAPENVPEPARFINAKRGNYRLAPDAPAIDAVLDTAVLPFEMPVFDLDGNPRIRGQYADLGCYEAPEEDCNDDGIHDRAPVYRTVENLSIRVVAPGVWEVGALPPATRDLKLFISTRGRGGTIEQPLNIEMGGQVLGTLAADQTGCLGVRSGGVSISAEAFNTARLSDTAITFRVTNGSPCPPGVDFARLFYETLPDQNNNGVHDECEP